MLFYPKSPNQPWPGYVPIDSLNPGGGNMGETSPHDRARLAGEHGRYLAGLGRTEGWGGDETYEDDTLAKLGAEDDTYGAGIFDPAGHGPTVNGESGVFEDHPNLPGYLGREVPFRPSSEVESIPSGAEVMMVPAGGMTWGGRLIGGGVVPSITSDTPFPGYPVEAEPTQSYIDEPLESVQPVSTVSAMVPVRALPPPSRAVGPTPARVAAQIGARQPTLRSVPPVPTTMFRPVARAAMQGFGADDAKPSIVPYVVSGALLGGALAVLHAVYKAK